MGGLFWIDWINKVDGLMELIDVGGSIIIYVTHWINPFWFFHLIPNFLLGKLTQNYTITKHLLTNFAQLPDFTSQK